MSNDDKFRELLMSGARFTILPNGTIEVFQRGSPRKAENQRYYQRRKERLKNAANNPGNP